MTVRLRWLESGEVALGQDYIHRLWKADHVLAREARLFAWQFRAGPVPGTLGFLTAEADGEPAGCIGMIPLPCHRHGEPFTGAVMTNLIVDPACRATALGLDIIREAYGGLDLVASIGINPRVARLYRLLGQHILTLPRYVCLGNPEALRTLLGVSANAAGLSMDRFAPCSPLRPPRGGAGYTVAPFSRDDLEAWDRAWTARFAPRLQGVVKDAAYLRWRYLEHPVFRYEGFAVRDRQGGIQGMTFLREAALPGQTAALRILDFLAADPEAGAALALAVSRRTPENAAFVEHAGLGAQWLPLREMGMSPEGADLFSVYFNPPDFNHCSILGALQVRLPALSPADFAANPGACLTIADGDQDRPN